MVKAADVSPERIRPLRRAEYDRLVETGAFANERVELLEGALVTMTPQDAAHAHTVQRLAEALTVALSGRAIVRSHSPLALLDDSEPGPDVAVAPSGDYSSAHPSAAWLVVEVSGTSHRRDRLVKGALYARGHVEEYWLFDLVERAVEVYRQSDGTRFTSATRYDERATLHPLRFADVDISILDMLPTLRR
ncbi:MAG TPA: Uma2 family endonuclease [Vicinamibacterales bacterium]|nr:Uma2 family endonuclease [Vicinamibacterales bacterium]